MFDYLTEICLDIMSVPYSYFEFQKLWTDEKYQKYRKEDDSLGDLGDLWEL
jgi:hypothetical protein